MAVLSLEPSGEPVILDGLPSVVAFDLTLSLLMSSWGIVMLKFNWNEIDHFVLWEYSSVRVQLKLLLYIVYRARL